MILLFFHLCLLLHHFLDFLNQKNSNTDRFSNFCWPLLHQSCCSFSLFNDSFFISAVSLHSIMKYLCPSNHGLFSPWCCTVSVKLGEAAVPVVLAVLYCFTLLLKFNVMQRNAQECPCFSGVTRSAISPPSHCPLRINHLENKLPMLCPYVCFVLFHLQPEFLNFIYFMNLFWLTVFKFREAVGIRKDW